jgi:ubiquinone/menaquinone biosynthesis C-methylase UbiE
MKRWMSTLSTVLSLGREAASTVKGSKPGRSRPTRSEILLIVIPSISTSPDRSLAQARLPLSLVATSLALAVLLGCATTPVKSAAGAESQPNAERYRSVARTADGIGKRYMGREIAGVMGWQGAPWLEREERQREERTDLLVAALPLRPGMVVADIGAGTGYLTRRMAPALMPGGRALAVDVQPQMVEMLEDMVRQTGLTQIQPLLGAEDDVRLPAASVDLAIMVDVYHELAYPFEMLDSITRALKPGGLLVFVEYRAEDERVPIKPVHKMTEAQIKREAAVHPLVWDRTMAALPWQHVVIFRKRD